MKIAVIKTGGKQYKIAEGDILKVEKLEGKEDEKISFEEVLLLSDDKEVKVGDPMIKGVKVEAKIVEQGKEKKLFGVKHKAKKRQLKKFGHRQSYTKIKIEKIA